MKPVIVSAPFGNWISSRWAMSTLGTYTVANRAGRFRWWLFWRILRTLRWRPALGGWTNKLGLPNPGIAHLEELAARLGAVERPETDDGVVVIERDWSTRTAWSLSRIVSLHGFNADEWSELLRRTKGLGFYAVELQR